jgi:hypothetical protein
MDYIDLYCERLAPGLWNEPLNALSNLAFFGAAWAIWNLAGRQPQFPIEIRILIGLTIAIGTGSTLFHTFATSWANLLDVLPILLFQLWFLWLYSRRVIKLKYLYAGLFLGIFFLANIIIQLFPPILNGSLSYAPAFLTLFGLGIYHYRSRQHEPLVLLAAAGVFFLSLTFRTLDQAICSYLPTGTHFLWHLFNGVLLYLSARGLILNGLNRFNIG